MFRRLGGVLGPDLDRHGKSRPPTGFDPRTVLLVVSRYTDCTIRAHKRTWEGTICVLSVNSGEIVEPALRLTVTL